MKDNFFNCCMYSCMTLTFSVRYVNRLCVCLWNFTFASLHMYLRVFVIDQWTYKNSFPSSVLTVVVSVIKYLPSLYLVWGSSFNNYSMIQKRRGGGYGGCNPSLSETRRGWKFWQTPPTSLGSETHKLIRVFLPNFNLLLLGQAEVLACFDILL